MYKFIYGPGFLLSTTDKEPKGLRENVIIITPKKDTFQHVEMTRACHVFPFNGGFVQKFETPKASHFFGESISARVKTDDTMERVYHKLLAHENYWKTEVIQDGVAYTVGMVLPADTKPEQADCWVKTTHKELCEIFESVLDRGW